jgi:hypothetical protein
MRRPSYMPKDCPTVDGAFEWKIKSKAKKHIFVEKPIALTLGDLYSMRDAVRRAGVKTAVGFVVRWTPLAMRLHQMIREGALGQVFLMDVDYWHTRRGRPEAYRRRATRTPGMVAFLEAMRAALREPFKAAQFGPLKIGVVDTALVIEEDIDLAVSLETGDGVNGDFASHTHSPSFTV